MANDLLDYLIDGKESRRDISAEQLELMGRQAASLYLDERIALNDGVAKLASEHPGINHEQIKRVVEFANTAVYLALHDKNKVAGTTSSYPQFDVADPIRIIQDMDVAVDRTVTIHVDTDYSRQPPTHEKIAAADADRMLQGLFQEGVVEHLDPSCSIEAVVTE